MKVPVNFVAVLVAGIVPLVVGAVWYNPKVFGSAWMDACGLDEEKLKDANMALIFGLTFVFSLLCAAFLIPVVIHQMHIISTLVNEPGFRDANSAVGKYIAHFMKTYGGNFRTFQHGAFHGVMTGLIFALPVLGINAMFERKGFKYIAINAGYWMVCFAIMGAIICGWH